MTKVSVAQVVSVLIALPLLVWPAVSQGQATYYRVYGYQPLPAFTVQPRPVPTTIPLPIPTVQPTHQTVFSLPTHITLPSIGPWPYIRPIGPFPTLPPIGPWPTLPPSLVIGPTATPQPLTPAATYVVLGDSMARGLYANKSYADHYQAYLTQTGTPVVEQNLGQLGWTSGDLLQALRTNTNFRQQVQSARVVTWNIGGNDLRQARDRYRNRSCGGPDNQDCLRQTNSQLKANWSGIISEITALRGGNNGTVRTMDIYNPYVAVDRQTDSWQQDQNPNDWEVTQTYVNEINSYIGPVTRSQGIAVAPVSVAFNGSTGTEDPGQKGYISFDGFHPNERGHQVIAQQLTGGSYPPIQPVTAPTVTQLPISYPTPYPTPYPVYSNPTTTPLVITPGGQCPAGTHQTMACTNKYPNSYCATICEQNTIPKTTTNSSYFIQELQRSLSRDL